MILNNQMTIERYPKPNEVVGISFLSVKSFIDLMKKPARWPRPHVLLNNYYLKKQKPQQKP